MAGHGIGGFQTPKFILLNAVGKGKQVIPVKRIRKIDELPNGSKIWFSDNEWDIYSESVTDVLHKLVLWSSM